MGVERDIRQIRREIDELNDRISGPYAVSGLDRRVERQLEHLSNKADKLLERMHNVDVTLKRAIDDIAQNKSLTESLIAGFAVIAEQVNGLKAMVADLQAKIDAGAAVSKEDVAALGLSVDTLEETNAAVAAAIPAPISAHG